MVLQFPGSALTDYDALIALEDHLIAALGDSADVDGHDSGQGQSNIFIHTSNPVGIFEQAKPVLEQAGCLPSLIAAYRDINGEEYNVLWPEGFVEKFDVL